MAMLCGLDLLDLLYTLDPLFIYSLVVIPIYKQEEKMSEVRALACSAVSRNRHNLSV